MVPGATDEQNWPLRSVRRSRGRSDESDHGEVVATFVTRYEALAGELSGIERILPERSEAGIYTRVIADVSSG